MTDASTGQIAQTAADVYEQFFVPALFQEWTAKVAKAAGVKAGDKVLDIACGTGVLAREIARRVGPDGRVVGLDRNEGMLAVARRRTPTIEWRSGRAEALPFEADTFDAVVSQFGLMFFDDRVKSIEEMWRVLAPGGRLAVAVWADLAHTQGYAAMTALLHRLFGATVADALRAPFVLGDPKAFVALFDEAEIPDAQLHTLTGWASFPSIEAWVHTDVKGWTLADMIDEAQYHTLLEAAQEHLRHFVQDDGSVGFESPAHIVTAKKPE